jgi:hypothetical protein
MSINVYQWDYVIAQTSLKKMSSLFDDLEYVKTYIDDQLTICKESWSEHLQHLDVVLIP